MIPYVLTVKTGDKRGAGTDAKVFVQIYGLDKKTEEIPIRNKSDNFERNQVNTDSIMHSREIFNFYLKHGSLK